MGMEVNKVLYKVQLVVFKEPHKELTQGREGVRAQLGRVSPRNRSAKVPLSDFGVRLRHCLASNFDALQDLDFMRGLILILVHVAPKGYVQLPVLANCLREDPPFVAMLNNVPELPFVVHEVLEDPSR